MIFISIYNSEPDTLEIMDIDNEDEIIYNFIKNNKLDFEKIIKYARETNNKRVLDKLYTLAR